MLNDFRPVAVFILLSMYGWSAWALEVEITQGFEGALPIAVVPFAFNAQSAADRAPPHNIGDIVSSDLHRSGRFKPLPVQDMLSRPSRDTEVDFRDWRALKTDSLLIGEVSPNGPGNYLIHFRLYDVIRGEQILGYSLPATGQDLRARAHQIADIVYEALLGQPGAFSTRIAYVAAIKNRQGTRRLHLRVADADGYNPQTIVSSEEPLMSPAWSPDGRKIAYVSFEQGKPAIWVQEVFTGKREKIASFKGINGAPAWSPDGRHLALTLSKDGNPNIYIMDLRQRNLRQITRHYAIDTEPAWSPDGKQLVFTSDRGGKPQIYRIAIGSDRAERVTFEGRYNARASYSPDGRYLALTTQVDGDFRIAVLDLQNNDLQILSNGDLDESPSFAPNGSMVIYATRAGDKNVLAAVSTDGRVKQRLALQAGDVREPAWSPYNQQKRN